MSSIAHWPASERPRERLLAHGAHALTDAELIAVVLFLDSQHRLLAADELFRGTLAQTSVYPREVVKAALARNAAAVIFAHNHPSGVAEPSRADELLTQALKQALALVDIRTLDHFVVAGHRVVSFAERGLL
jgi:DNA repair protein RadC